jgi:hypothetical protein
MRIVITGSSGLVGSALVSALRGAGHDVFPLVRRADAGPGSGAWDPLAGKIDSTVLEGSDAVIHLSGDNLADGRWTAAKKRRIVESRVRSTTVLAEAISKLTSRPKIFLSASAIGFYGDRGAEILTEDSPLGAGFIADACRQWEAATAAAESAQIRTVHLRIGVVLTSNGGALEKMIPPFRMGMGGKIGSGRQYLSWITLDDLVAAVQHLLEKSRLAGAVNMVAPQSVTNEQFTKALGHALHRPTVMAMPAFAARLMFGEMADATILASARIVPRRLESDGFSFRYPELSGALAHLLREKGK